MMTPPPPRALMPKFLRFNASSFLQLALDDANAAPRRRDAPPGDVDLFHVLKPLRFNEPRLSTVSLGAVSLGAADARMIDAGRGAFSWRFTSRFRSRASRKNACLRRCA